MKFDTTSPWYKQVQLLVRCLPVVFQERCFALKGGTAINLFDRNLPRLSVDIDLVYLPNHARQDALPAIQFALQRIAIALPKAITGLIVNNVFEEQQDSLRLIVHGQGASIKIELSPVLRGTVYPPQELSICSRVEDEFGYARVPVTSGPDLWAGKICAALDRQHPRDFFDVQHLLNSNGLTPEVRKALTIYLISHNRPCIELLNPRIKSLEGVFEKEFRGMTFDAVGLNDLEATRRALIEKINAEFSIEEKEFLISFHNLSPHWELLGLQGVADLPAVKWKQINLERMDSGKRQRLVDQLQQHFFPN